MGNIRVVTPELIEKARELKSKGLNRQQIALELHVSYSKISKIFGTERLGIDTSKRVPWNIETLKLLQENYKKLPIQQLCFCFNRTRAEIRELLSHLGWEIPIGFFKTNKEEAVEKIRELSDRYNHVEISQITGFSKSYVQSVCSKYKIQCSTKKRAKNSVARSEYTKSLRELANSLKQKILKAQEANVKEEQKQ